MQWPRAAPGCRDGLPLRLLGSGLSVLPTAAAKPVRPYLTLTQPPPPSLRLVAAKALRRMGRLDEAERHFKVGRLVFFFVSLFLLF